MFFPAVLLLIASTFALPTLELLSGPEARVIASPGVKNPDVTYKEKTETYKLVANQRSNLDKEDKVDEKVVKNEAERIIKKEVERIIDLPVLPSPPQLQPLDKSVFGSLLRAEKLEDSQDGSEDLKPVIVKWKLPRIVFPGHFIVNDVFGPHLTLKV